MERHDPISQYSAAAHGLSLTSERGRKDIDVVLTSGKRSISALAKTISPGREQRFYTESGILVIKRTGDTGARFMASNFAGETIRVNFVFARFGGSSSGSDDKNLWMLAKLLKGGIPESAWSSEYREIYGNLKGSAEDLTRFYKMYVEQDKSVSNAGTAGCGHAARERVAREQAAQEEKKKKMNDQFAETHLNLMLSELPLSEWPERVIAWAKLNRKPLPRPLPKQLPKHVTEVEVTLFPWQNRDVVEIEVNGDRGSNYLEELGIIMEHVRRGVSHAPPDSSSPPGAPWIWMEKD